MSDAGLTDGGYSIFHDTIADMTYPELERSIGQGAVALWGLGVIEQHGPHLPLGTDAYLPYARLRRVRALLADRGVSAVAIPPFYWGVNQVTGAFTGSIHVRPEIMVPLVGLSSELARLRALVVKEADRVLVIKRAKIDYTVGTMIEVPSLFFQLPALLRRVDFVSVGSNDLMQFLYASDRGNPLLADRYDPLAPGALAFLAAMAQACAQADVPITLCGEMGGRPLEAMALVGLGYRSLSMPPAAVGPVKAMVRSVEIDELERYLREQIRSSRRSIRENLLSFARDHGIAV